MQHRLLISTLKIASICVIAAYCSLMVAYLVQAGFLNQGEPPITILASRVLYGESVYHSPESDGRFVLPYGPAVFISNAFWQYWFDDVIFGSKLSGLVCATLALILYFSSFYRRFGPNAALICTALILMGLLWYKHYSFWNRPDSLILLCCAVILFSLELQQTWLRCLLIGLALGCMANSKLFAPLYVAAPLWFYLSRYGLKQTLAIVGIALLAFVLPFANTASFNAVNYLYWLDKMSDQALLSNVFIENIKMGFLLALPSTILISTVLYQQRFKNISYIIFSVALLGSLLAVCVIGSKIGAGVYYLMPLIPILVYIGADAYSVLQQLEFKLELSRLGRIVLMIGIGFWLVIVATMAWRGQADTIAFISDRQIKQLPEDIKQLQTRYAGFSIQMGYGSDSSYYITYFRPLLYAQGQAYLLDAPSYWDMRMAGIEQPSGLLEQFRQQKADLWLIPRGDQPFSMSLSDQSDEPLFVTIDELFEANYEKVASSSFFDIWRARRLHNRPLP